MERQDACVCLMLVLCSALLFLIPSPPQLARQQGSMAVGKVLEVDDTNLERHEVMLFGTQSLKVQLLHGRHKGKIFQAKNELRAQLELDKVFTPGSHALLFSLNGQFNEGEVLVAQDFPRIGWTLLLFSLFCLLLCIFGGWTGFNALLSFVFSCLAIWKAVVPLVLRGWPASWTILGCVTILTAVIMYLVARGLNKRCIVAFAGAISGIAAGLLTAHLFTVAMKINGTTLPYAPLLLYSGYSNLDLQDIFVGAMILASSGAVMDLGMDIACGIEEVARHNPTLPAKALLQSGLRIGRSVVGTMTTTLLLAYSGGYITLLMMFCAQGTSPWLFINNPLVAAEAVKTLVGSFGLVLVAPFTALIGSIVFAPKGKSA